MSDTTAEALTEAEREALAVGCSLFGWAGNDEATEHSIKAVERILADRLAAVQAEVLRLMAARDTYRKHAEADRDERDAARAEVEALRERVARVESLATQWNDTPDYTPSTYDQGRVDQRHDMTQQLLEVLEGDR